MATGAWQRGVWCTAYKWAFRISHFNRNFLCCEADNGSCIRRSAVTALRFNTSGVQLASGAQDTDIVVWDVVSQSGLFRLRGHHGQVCQRTFSQSSMYAYLTARGSPSADSVVRHMTHHGSVQRGPARARIGTSDCWFCRQVTGLAWLEGGGQLASCGKDGYVKVWDLATQHCSQTVVGHRCATLWQELACN